MRRFRRAPRPSPPSRRFRPGLEALEDRRVPAVTYHGGALLTHVDVEPVFYGRDWNQGALNRQSAQLDNFLAFLVGGPYLDMLGEYGVGRGSLLDPGIVDPGIAGGQTVDDTAIQAMLSADIATGQLHAPDANRLYLVFTAPNVVVTSAGQSSLKDFFGYHNAFLDAVGQPVRYAVVVHPVGNGDFYSLDDFQTLTKVASHEVAECATDPTALTNLDAGGWFGPFPGFTDNQEIADVADGQHDVGTLGGYTVQAVWSARRGTVVLPAGAQPDPLFNHPAPPGSVPGNLAQVAAGLTHSDEYFAGLVRDDYQRYLGRLPSAAETQSWVAGFRQGMTDEQVRAAFIAAPEYFRRVGGTDAAWIGAVYRDLLGRPADPQGLLQWLNVLALGADRGTVAVGFATSAEAEGLVVRDDYLRYLGRPAGDAEVSAWVAAFGRGLTNEQVVAGFVGSEEYYQSPKKGHGSDAGWVGSAYADLLHRQPNADEINRWTQALD